MVSDCFQDTKKWIKNSHLVLVLNQKLDSLNGGSGGLGDGGGDTSHEEVGHEGTEVLGLGWVGHDAIIVRMKTNAWSETFKLQAAVLKLETSRKKLLVALAHLRCTVVK
jgi:hypothetical protein